MAKHGELTDKQESFCREYMIDKNGTQAAIRAGFSEKTANEQASRLLANVNVASRVRELQEEQETRTEITADFVIQSLKEVALRCMTNKPVMEWDYEAKALTQKVNEEGKGVYEFDSQGANRALELLGKHKGIFEVDNKQKQAVIQVNIDD